MNAEVLTKFEKRHIVARPAIKIGDTIEVDTVIRDGDKKRIQKFKGIVIAIKGKGASKTFTVRKISYGVGVEKIFPMYSPNVEAIKIIKRSNVKRSKLYFLRDRVGKAATTLKPGEAVTPEMNQIESIEEVVEVESEEEPAEVVDQVTEDTSESTDEVAAEKEEAETEEKAEEK
ncbi:50S ribosomal protein L19 [Candidatus Dojkabacteria bacterium]|uniref:Large ribosomal subunit protein bL19 n=1 Tax=Candidatus Dojkabacteria bacterium TaxID=2099670 RepID=A0A955RGH9_9BACT|nr:50S ribosomal protein L19 [Candidatus Dojkabacteria bacterium]